MAAAAGFSQNNASADGTFNFSSFSTLPSSSSDTKLPPQSNDTPPRVRNDQPRTTSAGFDPEALERGVKALKEITTSPYGKKVFEVVKKQEETKQTELAAKVAEFKQKQAQHETDVICIISCVLFLEISILFAWLERQRIIYDEQKNLAQHQAQTKSQMAKYEDELARKRMQAENEYHRARNQELVKLTCN